MTLVIISLLLFLAMVAVWVVLPSGAAEAPMLESAAEPLPMHQAHQTA